MDITNTTDTAQTTFTTHLVDDHDPRARELTRALARAADATTREALCYGAIIAGMDPILVTVIAAAVYG